MVRKRCKTEGFQHNWERLMALLNGGTVIKGKTTELVNPAFSFLTCKRHFVNSMSFLNRTNKICSSYPEDFTTAPRPVVSCLIRLQTEKTPRRNYQQLMQTLQNKPFPLIHNHPSQYLVDIYNKLPNNL